MSSAPLDFDGDGLKLFHAAYDSSEEYQQGRDEGYERQYQLFHAFLDMSQRNPDRANVTIPKIYATIMTKLPHEIRAGLSRRPFLPFTSQREEFKEYAALQSKMLDQMLYLAGFKQEASLGLFLKECYGTAFIEPLPYFKTDYRNVVVPVTVPSWDGPQVVDYVVKRIPIKVLRFKLTTYAPWEVKVDPYAINLESPDGCRYVIKIRIASKREIKKLAAQGAYPNLDIEKLDAKEFSLNVGEHRGLQILQSMGMVDPRPDGDIGVLFRYESPDRYMDIWNDSLIIRDQPNPHNEAEGGHGMINLSRMVHNYDPHTQARFWGNGEIKINEINQTLLNDLYNMALDNHNFQNQGITFYAEDHGVQPEELVYQIGNKIGFHLQPGEKLSDIIQPYNGQGLPPDHYQLLERVERYMDLTARSWQVQRGESTPGDQTLGEIGFLKEAGEVGLEMNVSTTEDIFMTDFAHKCLCHISQYARREDKAEYLGEEDAMRMLLMHPRDLPGGFDFTFKGSATVVNQAIKQRNLLQLSKEVTSVGQVTHPDEWLKVLFDTFDLTEEGEKVIKTREEQLAEQLVTDMQQITGGKGQVSAFPSQGQIGQESARAIGE